MKLRSYGGCVTFIRPQERKEEGRRKERWRAEKGVRKGKVEEKEEERKRKMLQSKVFISLFSLLLSKTKKKIL